MGSLSDSFYEYLLKLWLYKSRRDPETLVMFNNSIESIKRNMIKRSKNGLYYAAEFPFYQETGQKMEHLACFSGGFFALTSMFGRLSPSQRLEYEHLAVEITKTCHLSYSNTATKLGPGDSRRTQ